LLLIFLNNPCALDGAIPAAAFGMSANVFAPGAGSRAIKLRGVRSMPLSESWRPAADQHDAAAAAASGGVTAASGHTALFGRKPCGYEAGLSRLDGKVRNGVCRSLLEVLNQRFVSHKLAIAESQIWEYVELTAVS
jgi:hypothetical protein